MFRQFEHSTLYIVPNGRIVGNKTERSEKNKTYTEFGVLICAKI